MGFPRYFFLIQCPTLLAVINLSHESALVGMKVRDAKPNELPSVVSIGRRKLSPDAIEKAQYCTGTFVSNLRVLTAAHCLFELDVEDTVVVAGASNLHNAQQLDIESWITYDQWMSGNRTELAEVPYNDLAIITLEKPFLNVTPSKLLTFKPEDTYGSKLRIAGWGSSEDGKAAKVLKTAMVYALTNAKCNRLLARMTNQYNEISEDYFCSQAMPYVLSSCGDSGAPLFNKQRRLVAINVGACPTMEQLCGCASDEVCESQVNLHLHLYGYRHFIACVALSDREECKLGKRIKSGQF